MDLKKRLFEIFEEPSVHDSASRLFHIVIFALIFLNIVAVVEEFLELLPSEYEPHLSALEIFSVSIFTGEYLLRLFSCTHHHKYQHSVLGRVRFALSPLMLADLLAIAPFYLPILLALDLRFLRGFRFLRLLHIFELRRRD